MISLSAIDPSLAIGILALTKEDFFQFVTDYDTFEKSQRACMFTIEHSTPDYTLDCC
jgi:hypothetical protein